MKKYFDLIKNKIIDYTLSNWYSDKLFNKGKIIFIYIILLFIIIKLIYSIFN